MTRLSENDIEQLAIEELKAMGYQYLHGSVIAPDGEQPERHNYEQVLLTRRLRKALQRINDHLPEPVTESVINELQRLPGAELLAANQQFHRLLTEGVPVTLHKNGEDRGDLAWLVDFKNPENNDFLAVNQFTVVEGHHNRRLDVVLFINGLPLVVLELKNPAGEQATVQTAFKQVETYKTLIPSLFTYNGFSVISDGLEAKAGTISSGYSRFMAWKTADGRSEASPVTGQLEVLLQGMLNRRTLVDLLRHFIVFESTKKEDAAGIVTINTEKKLAGYHQYYAVNKAVESTLRAAGFVAEAVQGTAAEDPHHYGLHSTTEQPAGDRKGGVVWHTQGSGKSLSMVFYTGKMVLEMNNPTILVITDRNDLDDQLFDTFAASTQLLRQAPVQARNREHLKTLLKVASGGIIFTTIQKFSPEEGNIFETLSERSNIIVIADEAHRTQYGFAAKNIDVKDKQGNITGKKTVYGFAKYMRDALPNATYLGFTGTPIESTDVNTPAVFGHYVDVYDIAQAVEDGATVRIYYESRLAKVQLSEEGRKLVQEFDDELEEEELDAAQKAKAKWTQLEALVGSEQRIKNIARDIITHFEQRQQVFKGKAMIVTMSRRIAAALYDAINELRPEWHNKALDKGAIKVVMTAVSGDGPQMAQHHTNKEQRRKLADRMKDPNDELKLVIVRDMWLTGFDAPCLHTLYIDKPMKGHNLMQAIARVNRVFGDKPGGHIVDYLGIAADLKKALSFYSEAGGRGEPANVQEEALPLMVEKLEVVEQLLNGFDYQPYFTGTTSQKLSVILAAENHILGLEEGKKRFITEVTALSQALALAIPHDEAMDASERIAFFQSVKARLVKFETGTGRSDAELETTIRQVIDSALVSDQVIDIYDAAGIKKPDISILSEEFLMDLRNMPHKNIALEVLKKLLEDELHTRLRKNLVKSQALAGMLEAAIKKYQNKILTSAEVIEELIRLSREVTGMDTEAAQLGLTEYEYAFYTAVADNNSARELMQKDQLRELAIVLADRVRQNATIDWTIKESVRAKLRVTVKRLLRQYGYPPDMQQLATETVLKQAEKIAEDVAG